MAHTWLVVLLGLGIAVATPTPAAAGDCPDCPPPALYEDADAGAPTIKQAVSATRALLRALRDGSLERTIEAVSIPLLVDLVGLDIAADESGCADHARFVTEGEGLPGTPQCLIAGLGGAARKLERGLSRKVVHDTLAALERRSGKVRSGSREHLTSLAHHRLVFLRAGKLRLVIAVRLVGGEPRVDAVLAERR